MPRVEQIAPEDQHLNVLIYGYPGAGKTTLAATAQDHKDLADVLFLNVEGGLLSIPASQRKKIGQMTIRETASIEEAFWQLQQREDEVARFSTVVIDSGSELQTLNLEGIVRDRIKRRGKGDQDTLFMEDYGTSTAQLKRLFRWFRDLQMHLIVTALPKEIRGQGENPPLEAVKPSFTNKLGESVLGYMDMVWYLYQDQDGNRQLLTETQGAYFAKTRGSVFPEALGKLVANPTMPAIWEVLRKSEFAH
jgi:hypothetical protein